MSRGPTCSRCGVDAHGAERMPEHRPVQAPGMICPGSEAPTIEGEVETDLERAQRAVRRLTRMQRDAAEKVERTLASVRADVRGSGPRHLKSTAHLRAVEQQLEAAKAELSRLSEKAA